MTHTCHTYTRVTHDTSHHRGFKPTGKLAYILERCIADVLKFVSLFVLWDLGFTLAFFTMQVCEVAV